MPEELIEQAAPVIHPAPGIVSEEAEPVAPAAEVAEEQAEPTAEQKPKGNGFQRRISTLVRRNHDLQDALRNFDNRLRSLEHRGIEVVDDEADASEWARTRNAQQSQGVSLHLRERKEIEAELGKVQSELAQHLPAEQGPLTPDPETLQSAIEQRVQQELMIRDHNSRVEAASQNYDDWKEVAEAVKSDDVHLHPQLVQIVMGLPNSADVVYALGKDRDLARKIATMEPIRAIGELVKLSGEAAAPLTSAKPEPRTPAPIRPVKKAGPTSNSLDDSLSVDEWLRRRNAQLKKK